MLKETATQLIWSIVVFTVVIGGYYIYTHTACIAPLKVCMFLGW